MLETFKGAFDHAGSPGKRGGRILKIILFGSYAKGSWVNDPAHGYVSDYDVLVIVNNEKLVEDYRFWNRIEERIQEEITAPFSPIVHSLTNVNARLKEEPIFLRIFARTGFSKTHNLKRLLVLCVQQEPCFGSLFPQDTKHNRRCFELLKRAYVEGGPLFGALQDNRRGTALAG